MKTSLRSDMLVAAFQVKTVSRTELFTSKLSGFAHDQFKKRRNNTKHETRKKNTFLFAIHKRALCSKQDRETWHGCHLTTNPSSNIRRVRFVPLGDALRLISLKG